MSDNKLLSENTIRRFMKLANTEALSSNFLEEMAHGAKPEDKKKPKPAGYRGGRYDKMEESPVDEDTLEESEEELEEEFDLGEQFDLEEQEEDEGMDMDADLGADMDMDAAPADDEPAVGAADMSLTEEEARVLISLGERLSEAMAGADAEDDEPPVDDAMDDAMAAGAEEEEEEEELAGMGNVDARMEEDTINQEELVQEVLKRVTKRLVAQKLKG